ncbi:MAG: hypothetical protein RL074_1041, partial [Bacteroidota bacterium]
SSALKSIDDLGLRGKITIIGIAKRLEELFYPGDSIPLYLDKKSETLKVIQQLRNEAHRFGITHHRDKRSKAALNSSIESIPGIGEKTMTTLIQHFKSVKRLKLATEKEISEVVGLGGWAIKSQKNYRLLHYQIIFYEPIPAVCSKSSITIFFF